MISCFSSASFIELPTHYWVFFGIYDGHNGSRVSSYLSQNLRHSIMGTLSDLYSKHTTLPDAHIDLGNTPESSDYLSGASSGRPYPPTEEFDTALKQGFLNVDKEIVEEAAERALEAVMRHRNNIQQENLLSYPDAADLVSRAHCGSSAVVAVYENDTRQLRLANVGDSRAVLGRRVVDEGGKEVWEVHVLTKELAVPSGFITDPLRRDQKVTGSVHSFGDGPWKWSEETWRKLSDGFPFIIYNERPFAKATAEPVITNIETQPGDFLVIANQGLWTSLTNEEAIGLVGLWLKKYGRTVYGNQRPEEGEGLDVYDSETSSIVRTLTRIPSPSTYTLLRKDVFVMVDLPVTQHEKKDETFMYRLWSAPKKFVLVDKNAALHLVRNALGGADTDLLDALVKMHVPRSRQYRWVTFPGAEPELKADYHQETMSLLRSFFSTDLPPLLCSMNVPAFIEFPSVAIKPYYYSISRYISTQVGSVAI
jgi:pyruvate dehydrogenase phosphatase